MKEYTSQPQPADLNEHEFKVLIACAANIEHTTDCDFGFSDEIVCEGFTPHQIAGYLSQLCQKGYISIDDEYDQLLLSNKGVMIFDLHEFRSYNGITRKDLLNT